MSESHEARWRAYAEDRDLVPIEVLAEIIRHWDEGSKPSHNGWMRPNRPGDLDAAEDRLWDEVVAACDRLLERERTRA